MLFIEYPSPNKFCWELGYLYAKRNFMEVDLRGGAQMIVEDIIGHKGVREYFNRAIHTGTLSHAHLIIGEDGIGKSLIAKESAISILGKKELKQYVDIIEFRSKKNKKSIGVDDIREINEEISKKPFEGDKKVIIIYEGDKITAQAQNAFLKTIEEPPRGVFIFILCESPEMILDTIKSRCQIHKLNKLNGKEIKLFLNRKYSGLSEEELDTMLSFCDGVPGRAEKFVEDENFKSIRNITAKLLIDINTMKESEVLEYEEDLLKFKDSWDEVLASLLSYIRDIMIYKDVEKDELIVNKDKLAVIKEASALFSFNRLNNIIKLLNDTREFLNSNANTAITYDVMLLKMLEA
jgi:DNA polymerase-3 subunit delta'